MRAENQKACVRDAEKKSRATKKYTVIVAGNGLSHIESGLLTKNFALCVIKTNYTETRKLVLIV